MASLADRSIQPTVTDDEIKCILTAISHYVDTMEGVVEGEILKDMQLTELHFELVQRALEKKLENVA